MKTPKLLRILMLVIALSLISTTALAANPAASALTRIRFAQGATSAVVSGKLAANSTARYVLRAGFRQLLDATLSAPEGASLKVTTSGGRTLTPVAGTSGSTGFRGYLPYTGDFFLTVASGSKAVSYSVNVFIPVRVSFARGATSDTVEGSLDAHQGLDYILRAGEGQILEIQAAPENTANTENTEGDENTEITAGTEPITTTENTLQLIIYGVDGSVLRSGMGEGSSFRGELPASQDYIVSVRAEEQAADFTMDIIIPQRIRFQTGAVSASVSTNLPANHTQYYVLRAAKNQTMQVTVTPGDKLQLAVYGADGALLLQSSDTGEGAGAGFSGKLPTSQDYILAVSTRATRVLYRLRVTIK